MQLLRLNKIAKKDKTRQRKKELACLTTNKPPNQNRFIVETNLPTTLNVSQ